MVSRPRNWVDPALAATAVATLVTDVLLMPGGVRFGALAVAVVYGGVLAVRRRFPRAVLVATLVGLVAYSLLTGPGMVATVPLLVAVFTATDAGHGLLAALLVDPPLLAVVTKAVLTPQPGQTVRDVVQTAFLPVGWFLAAWVLGKVTRQRREYVAQVEARAAEAVRTREEVARRRAGQERLRIARELHDTLTHAISVIKVQAGVAVHLAAKRGDDVPDSLVAIRDASRTATRELRRTLEVLRDPDDTAPGAGLADLPRLIADSRAAGVTAALSIVGEAFPLPSDVDLAAFRVVQEALTNVARHSGASAAEVEVSYGDVELTVAVTDAGRGDTASPPVPGIGLIGMRERVTALGGRLSAAPTAGGGFAVRAVLPLAMAGAVR
ncbi:sensor histidine kinase [Actinorhabdospora filicis]|nr:sensor histidine kinase [Actinorhabdospora filicis]